MKFLMRCDLDWALVSLVIFTGITALGKVFVKPVIRAFTHICQANSLELPKGLILGADFPVVSLQKRSNAEFDVATQPTASKLVQTTFSHHLPMKVSDHSSVRNLLKRFIDIIGASVGLLVTALFIIPIAATIYLDDPGPIFYSQVRCGHRGKTFRIWKFRSMVANADALKHLVDNEAQGLVFKNKNDPRITRVGKFLRKTSLDEFPQFWNVLLGDMSLVGTRPPTVDEVLHYEPHHWQRLEVKPGITGEWQVRGRSSVSDFEDIVKMDLQYQDKWSVFYDIRLILETVLAVLKRKGAY